METIKNRRNTKVFEDKEIENTQIEILLESATWAPNHRNTEPWRFYVVGKGSSLRNKISEGMIALQENSSNDKLSQDQKDGIKQSLRKILGDKLSLNFFVDKKIIGGLIVKVGSKMIDSSISSKINKLKIAMKGA